MIGAETNERDWCYSSIEAEIMALLVYFGSAMALTVPLTGLLCRYRIARQRRISYGTMLLGATAASMVVFLGAGGWEIFRPDYWAGGHKSPPSFALVLLGYTAAFCVLPALGVVIFYERRGKRDEPYNTTVGRRDPPPTIRASQEP